MKPETIISIIGIALSFLSGGVGLFLGHKLSIRREKDAYKRQILLNELNQYREFVNCDIFKIISEDTPQEEIKKIILSQQTLISNKTIYVCELLKLIIPDQNQCQILTTRLDDMKNVMTGDGFSEKNRYLPNRAEYEKTKQMLSKVIDSVILTVLRSF